jgi:hypothetical protein
MLKEWERNKVHPVEEQIHNKEEELRALQLQDHPNLPKLEAPITAELHDLMEQEDLKWKQ